MAGEYTAKVQDYSGIINQNQIVTEDGEIVKLNKRCLENIAMDFINLEEQKKEKLIGVINYKKDSDEFKAKINELCGSFYFNFYKRLLGKVKPQHITRLLYLSCFMDYDNLIVSRKNNGNKIPVYESALADILNIGKTEFYNTKKELINNNLIIINNNKTVSINQTYCKKGEIMKNKKVEKVRIFEDAIKELYEKATPKEHKTIGFLFELLPFISYKYNIVSHNPEQLIKEIIEPYSIRELCEIFEYKNITEFKRKLEKLKIGGNPVVCINRIDGKEFITINPKVYYKGARNIEGIKELEGIIAIFESSKNIK